MSLAGVCGADFGAASSSSWFASPPLSSLWLLLVCARSFAYKIQHYLKVVLCLFCASLFTRSLSLPQRAFFECPSLSLSRFCLCAVRGFLSSLNTSNGPSVS